MKRLALLFIVLLILNPFDAVFAQTGVKTKIGIMMLSGNKVQRVKSNDRAFVGDKFRVFVKPLVNGHVYVVYTDSGESLLLNHGSSNFTIDADHTLILPDEENFYAFDDNSSNAVIDVYVSSGKLDMLETAFGTMKLPSSTYEGIKNDIVNRVKTEVRDETEESIVMAGNVRGINQDFGKKLQTFSDSEIVLKQYHIEIKK
jgi:hypothetical protein